MNSKQAKPSIVFVHGIWADGSSFSKLIPTLQAEGHEVIAAQYGLDTLAGDVAALVVAQLTRSILSLVTHGEPLVKLALDQIATLLGAHVLQLPRNHRQS